MVVGRRQQLELREDVGDVRLDGLRGEIEAGRRSPGSSGPPPSSARTSRSRSVRSSSGTLRPPPADELGDDLGVDDRAALGDPSDRVGEVVEVVDTVLEQVADAAGSVGDQPEGEGRLDVLGQDEDADRRPVLGPDRLGGPQTLRRCASAASGCRRSRRPAAARGLRRAAASASPAWATTSNPASTRSRAIPSRRRRESSARTRRRVTRSRRGPGSPPRTARPSG